jgi:energy-coupling factor transporter transmembrane protein EcfT
LKAGKLEKGGKGLWLSCLVAGTILLLAGSGIRVPAIGLALTGIACFWRCRKPRRIRSLVKFMIPILIFLCAYGLLLYLSPQPDSPASHPTHPMANVAHLFLRSVGLLFAMFALEEALHPVALRVRAGGFKGNKMALMVGLSYQLVPVFLHSLEGVSLSQRADSSLWWLRPSRLMRAASSMFLLSYRLSEEMALALSLRLGQRGPSETSWLGDLSPGPQPATGPASAEKAIEP